MFSLQKVKNNVLFSKKCYFLGSKVRVWEQVSGWGLGLVPPRCPWGPSGAAGGLPGPRSPADRTEILVFSSFSMCEDKGRVGRGGDCVVVGDMIIEAIDGKTHS